jgi:hypothetical protein
MEEPWRSRVIGPAPAGKAELDFIDGGPDLLAKTAARARPLPDAFLRRGETVTLQLLRDLRNSASTLPANVLGPCTAFRMAVSIARLDATDCLE